MLLPFDTSSKVQPCKLWHAYDNFFSNNLPLDSIALRKRHTKGKCIEEKNAIN